MQLSHCKSTEHCVLFFQVGKSAQKACGGHACIDRYWPDDDLILIIYFFVIRRCKRKTFLAFNLHITQRHIRNKQTHTHTQTRSK